MTEAEDFVELFLEHAGMTKEERAAYNREYYLRTRKLKGPRAKAGDVPQPKKFKSTEPRRIGAIDGGSNRKVTRPKSAEQLRAEKRRRFQKQDERTPARRVAENEQKIMRARQKAKKLPPEKRNAIEKKLDAAERKLNKLKKKIKNPFSVKKIDRSRPVVRNS